MIKEILGFVRQGNSNSSDEIRSKLDQLDIDAARAKIDELERERGRLLLDGDDASVTECEGRIAAARRDVERMGVLKTELESRLSAALEAEASAALSAKVEVLASHGRDLSKLLTKDYVAAAKQISGIMTRLSEYRMRRQEIMAELDKAGRWNDCPPDPEMIAFPNIDNPEMAGILNCVRLPEFEDQAGLGWADVQRQFRLRGFSLTAAK